MTKRSYHKIWAFLLVLSCLFSPLSSVAGLLVDAESALILNEAPENMVAAEMPCHESNEAMTVSAADACCDQFCQCIQSSCSAPALVLDSRPNVLKSGVLDSSAFLVLYLNPNLASSTPPPII